MKRNYCQTGLCRTRNCFEYESFTSRWVAPTVEEVCSMLQQLKGTAWFLKMEEVDEDSATSSRKGDNISLDGRENVQGGPSRFLSYKGRANMGSLAWLGIAGANYLVDKNKATHLKLLPTTTFSSRSVAKIIAKRVVDLSNHQQSYMSDWSHLFQTLPMVYVKYFKKMHCTRMHWCYSEDRGIIELRVRLCNPECTMHNINLIIYDVYLIISNIRKAWDL